MRKRKFLILFSLMVLLVAGVHVHGQPKARKFDELAVSPALDDFRCTAEYEEQRKHMEARLLRYARQLKLEKAKAYIIGYGPRVKRWEIYNRSFGDMRAGEASSELSQFFDYRRITAIDGGAREKAVTELWIVPPGAAAPVATPTVKPEDVSECPFIRVLSPGYVPKANEQFKIKAAIESNQKKTQPTFNWHLSSGRIVDGQGTNTITVELPADSIGKVFAKVEVGGYASECPHTSAVSTLVVGMNHFLYDSYEDVCDEDEMARLDNFAIYLSDSPELQAYVVVYEGRCYSSCGFDYPLHRRHLPRKGHADRRGLRIKDYLYETRGIAKDRVTIVNGGFRESFEAELWVTPRGAPPPPLTPTVLPQDVKYKTGRLTKRELTSGCLPQK